MSLSTISSRVSLVDNRPAPGEQLATWLQLVDCHAKAGSFESQNTLFELASNIPEYSFAPLEVRKVIDKIKEIAEKKEWDKALSPTSTKALKALFSQLHPADKPKCARRLDFFTDNGDEIQL